MSWEDCLREDIKVLVTCGAIYLMDNWHNSRGARLEKYIAENLGLRVFREEDECATA